jgi:DMSO/TMAO reductase YedYZ molybdopterin-dependent catalytic subunit
MTDKKLRIMTEKPLNAETPIEKLRTWTTDNTFFFKRNQGHFADQRIALSDWRLTVSGLVQNELELTFADMRRFPKVELANTLECSGNSRSLLTTKASGNPWTVGGVGNAVWGGCWLKELLARATPKNNARHVSFAGFDKPTGKAGIKFVRSIPIEKALDSTLLAYEMNGEPLPPAHGYPLRALALGWTGANCVKWLSTITLLEQPQEGFFMDKVYRVFQKGEDSKSGEVVTGIDVKSIILEPTMAETLPAGVVPIRGAAYAGEAGIRQVEISVDDGLSWQNARLLELNVKYAWRHWEYLWEINEPGQYTIMTRATDTNGKRQPETAVWNFFGYGNNGVREHAVEVTIS